ncbi:unnamed protein product [Amoebophrya sp. A25]|nr:unnamed protein product [Amoebophrya sp. A25]|eukprot:GSA25T00002456001.1
MGDDLLAMRRAAESPEDEHLAFHELAARKAASKDSKHGHDVGTSSPTLVQSKPFYSGGRVFGRSSRTKMQHVTRGVGGRKRTVYYDVDDSAFFHMSSNGRYSNANAIFDTAAAESKADEDAMSTTSTVLGGAGGSTSTVLGGAGGSTSTILSAKNKPLYSAKSGRKIRAGEGEQQAGGGELKIEGGQDQEPGNKSKHSTGGRPMVQVISGGQQSFKSADAKHSNSRLVARTASGAAVTMNKQMNGTSGVRKRVSHGKPVKLMRGLQLSKSSPPLSPSSLVAGTGRTSPSSGTGTATGATAMPKLSTSLLALISGAKKSTAAKLPADVFGLRKKQREQTGNGTTGQETGAPSSGPESSGGFLQKLSGSVSSVFSFGGKQGESKALMPQKDVKTISTATLGLDKNRGLVDRAVKKDVDSGTDVEPHFQRVEQARAQAAATGMKAGVMERFFSSMGNNNNNQEKKFAAATPSTTSGAGVDEQLSERVTASEKVTAELQRLGENFEARTLSAEARADAAEEKLRSLRYMLSENQSPSRLKLSNKESFETRIGAVLMLLDDTTRRADVEQEEEAQRQEQDGGTLSSTSVSTIIGEAGSTVGATAAANTAKTPTLGRPRGADGNIVMTESERLNIVFEVHELEQMYNRLLQKCKAELEHQRQQQQHLRYVSRDRISKLQLELAEANKLMRHQSPEHEESHAAQRMRFLRNKVDRLEAERRRLEAALLSGTYVLGTGSFPGGAFDDVEGRTSQLSLTSGDKVGSKSSIGSVATSVDLLPRNMKNSKDLLLKLGEPSRDAAALAEGIARVDGLITETEKGLLKVVEASSPDDVLDSELHSLITSGIETLQASAASLRTAIQEFGSCREKLSSVLFDLKPAQNASIATEGAAAEPSSAAPAATSLRSDAESVALQRGVAASNLRELSKWLDEFYLNEQNSDRGVPTTTSEEVSKLGEVLVDSTSAAPASSSALKKQKERLNRWRVKEAEFLREEQEEILKDFDRVRAVLKSRFVSFETRIAEWRVRCSDAAAADLSLFADKSAGNHGTTSGVAAVGVAPSASPARGTPVTTGGHQEPASKNAAASTASPPGRTNSSRSTSSPSGSPAQQVRIIAPGANKNAAAAPRSASKVLERAMARHDSRRRIRERKHARAHESRNIILRRGRTSKNGTWDTISEFTTELDNSSRFDHYTADEQTDVPGASASGVDVPRTGIADLLEVAAGLGGLYEDETKNSLGASSAGNYVSFDSEEGSEDVAPAGPEAAAGVGRPEAAVGVLGRPEAAVGVLDAPQQSETSSSLQVHQEMNGTVDLNNSTPSMRIQELEEVLDRRMLNTQEDRDHDADRGAGPRAGSDLLYNALNAQERDHFLNQPPSGSLIVLGAGGSRTAAPDVVQAEDRSGAAAQVLEPEGDDTLIDSTSRQDENEETSLGASMALNGGDTTADEMANTTSRRDDEPSVGRVEDTSRIANAGHQPQQEETEETTSSVTAQPQEPTTASSIPHVKKLNDTQASTLKLNEQEESLYSLDHHHEADRSPPSSPTQPLGLQEEFGGASFIIANDMLFLETVPETEETESPRDIDTDNGNAQSEPNQAVAGMLTLRSSRPSS